MLAAAMVVGFGEGRILRDRLVEFLDSALMFAQPLLNDTTPEALQRLRRITCGSQNKSREANKESLHFCLLLTRCLRRLPPQPFQRLRQNRAAVFAVVRAITIDELVIVLLKLERQGHLLVSERPVAEQVVEVAGAVLEEDA